MAQEQQAAPPNAHVPKTEIETRHKVQRFGIRHRPQAYDEIKKLEQDKVYVGEELKLFSKNRGGKDFSMDELQRQVAKDPRVEQIEKKLTDRRAKAAAEDKLYQFLHQQADLKISRGVIPVGFYSVIQLEEGHPVYLETRSGGTDERDNPIGPEYQVTWRKDKEIIGVSPDVGWSGNLDELWSAVLAIFERKNLLSEGTLDYLDADPYVLFGVDDRISQQALEKLDRFPALLCEEAAPSIPEWCAYLRLHEDEYDMRWLVQAFSETELPKPWTCYKGVGSIVCYIRADSGQVTWKHPFYDYFRQLRDFCRQANLEEVMQVRVNRLLWSYEATRVETEHDQEPLVSPDYVQRLGDIFGHDVKSQGYLVRNLKAQIKVFSRTYRDRQEIDIGDVITCDETLARDCAKYEEMRREWGRTTQQEVAFDLDPLANGNVKCVNCSTVALSFCLECKDYLCLDCYDSLHRQGARRDHAPFRLVSCSLCVTMPAKLHCTFTDKSLCHECYALKHINMLPPDGKENHPRRIDYKQQYTRYANFARDRTKGLKDELTSKFDTTLINEEDPYESVLSTDWHPFYDTRGVKFYHNFQTGERMRQSPRRVPNTEDKGAEGAGDVAGQGGFAAGDPNETFRSFFSTPGKDAMQNTRTGPLSLEGYQSLETFPKAAEDAAMEPEQRSLRAPHRVHMPHEVPNY